MCSGLALARAVGLVCVGAAPAIAQEDAATTVANAPAAAAQTAGDATDDDGDSGRWGLVGLLGPAGLHRHPARAVVSDSVATATTRRT